MFDCYGKTNDGNAKALIFPPFFIFKFHSEFSVLPDIRLSQQSYDFILRMIYGLSNAPVFCELLLTWKQMSLESGSAAFLPIFSVIVLGREAEYVSLDRCSICCLVAQSVKPILRTFFFNLSKISY